MIPWTKTLFPIRVPFLGNGSHDLSIFWWWGVGGNDSNHTRGWEGTATGRRKAPRASYCEHSHKKTAPPRGGRGHHKYDEAWSLLDLKTWTLGFLAELILWRNGRNAAVSKRGGMKMLGGEREEREPGVTRGYQVEGGYFQDGKHWGAQWEGPSFEGDVAYGCDQHSTRSWGNQRGWAPCVVRAGKEERRPQDYLPYALCPHSSHQGVSFASLRTIHLVTTTNRSAPRESCSSTFFYYFPFIADPLPLFIDKCLLYLPRSCLKEAVLGEGSIGYQTRVDVWIILLTSKTVPTGRRDKMTTLTLPKKKPRLPEVKGFGPDRVYFKPISLDILLGLFL